MNIGIPLEEPITTMAANAATAETTTTAAEEEASISPDPTEDATQSFEPTSLGTISGNV